MTSEPKISLTLNLTKAQIGNLAGLITAGAKSPATGSDGIVVAAELLILLQQAANEASEKSAASKMSNGHAADAEILSP
jgi:hypothetical protein